MKNHGGTIIIIQNVTLEEGCNNLNIFVLLGQPIRTILELLLALALYLSMLL